METIDLERIAARNPRIDIDKLSRTQDTLRELAKCGIAPSSYNIRPPFGHVPLSQDREKER